MDSNLNQLAPINFNDGFILGQQPHEAGFRASTFDEFSKWLNIRLDLQGAELIDPTPAGTIENPAIIPAGPEDRKGKFEPSPGFYEGFPEIKENKRYYFYWNKTNWTLWDLGNLPDSSSKSKPWEMSNPSHSIGDLVSHNNNDWVATTDTTAEPKDNSSDWRKLGATELNEYVKVGFSSENSMHVFTNKIDEITHLLLKNGDFASFKYPNGISHELEKLEGNVSQVKNIFSQFDINGVSYLFTDSAEQIVGKIMKKDGALFLYGLEKSVQEEILSLRKGGAKSYESNAEIKSSKLSSLTQKGNDLLMKRIVNGLTNFIVPFGVMPQDWDLNQDAVKALTAPRTSPHIPIKMMNGNTLNEDSGVVHPNVTSFDFPVNGYKYWMTLNGYPDETWEITWLYGTNHEDLTGWELVSSLPQPFDGNPPLQPPYISSHDSDSFMTYNPLTGEMVVVWRRSMRTATTETTEYQYRASNNGIDWSEPKVLYHPTLSTDDLLLSAGIVFNPNDNLFYMFYIHPEKIRYRTNKDLYNPDGWSAHTIIESPNGIKPWHLDVKFVGSSFMLLIHENQNRSPGNDKLWFAMSTDLINWTWSDTDLLGGTGPLYKSSFLPIDNGNGTMKFKIFYTTDETAPMGEDWKLHVTETASINI
ncbi:hypothetical protein CHU00_02195 [Sphingobacterium cellulitidis]|uniref:hypothetical protein n=1 Tax=Sphingobacterium cellulitidis TaxID=1768011 RepID=UPI000B93AC6C|nr:hypothetical protein [Sphingobacterium cellulitidis]OYD47702.1 hypothetical protein CHU00_02195 [Sphingobacterium cellulitidis]